ncbi:MAG: DNA polymerase I [Oscillospiraceae bacterium]|nr:DNA polymerase I [Oscillospiraceae bacterium]
MRLLVLDGNSIVNRAFYGIRQLNASDGTPTNAVYGFLSILNKLTDEEQPEAICVTFDLPEPTFRHKRYDGYKAKRAAMPDELAVQMPILKDVLDAMRITRCELAGWEADDLLGTLAQACAGRGWECVIVTGDKDSFQLISGSTRVKHVKTRMGQTETLDYTVDAFKEEYGFPPEMMIDLKALMGDASDNIPGVAGVGEKTALDLVRRFGRVSGIYAELETLDIKDTLRKKLADGRESAEMSYDLARIRTDAPLGVGPDECLRRDADDALLYDILKRLGFAKMIDKYGLKQSGNSQGAQAGPVVRNVVTAKDCAALVDAAKKARFTALTLDTEFFDVAALSIPGSGEVHVLRRGVTEDYHEAFKTLLGPGVRKAGHGVKDIMRACLDKGYATGGWVFDTALAAYLVAPTESNYAIARVSERYCGYTPAETQEEEGGQLTLLADTGKNMAYDAYAVGLLRGPLGDKLIEGELEDLFSDIEFPLCPVLADMESTGFLVDKEALRAFGEDLSGSIAGAESQIYEQAGEEFNINSTKQLGAILFDKLQLPSPKKTKTGYSTNIEVLDYLAGRHAIIGLIKDYRELTKLKSTYVDGLLKVIGPDGRIHTRFMMTVTATGRLSSTEPNLQNIPVRKEIGAGLRKMFVAGEGNVLVDADYSQIELRLLAHIAGDPVMRAAFESGEDIHAVTASQVFGVPLGYVTPVLRSRAKAVNFGIVYGISAFSLAQDIGVSQSEAKAYMDSYLDKYAGVREYMSSIVTTARAQGYVTTLYGRRRYLPELASANYNTRSFGERVALNMPIQGSAADIIKIAMINASKKLSKLNARLILQVHDELIAECPEGEAEEVSAILRAEMENAAKLSVPLLAEAHTGKSWHDAK